MDKRIETQTLRDADLILKHTLIGRLAGGYVRRYHTRPELSEDQDVAAHSWRAMVLLHTLWPDASRECLLYMMYHDVAEGELGDLPATTKWRHPDLSQMMKELEHDVDKELGITQEISSKEKCMCDIADKLELVLHCHRLLKMGNVYARDVFIRGLEYISKYEDMDLYAPVGALVKQLNES